MKRRTFLTRCAAAGAASAILRGPVRAATPGIGRVFAAPGRLFCSLLPRDSARIRAP